jgi:hypothetical protein
LFTDCPEGTVCDESCGHPVCSFANENVCPPYVPPPPPQPETDNGPIYGSAPEPAPQEPAPQEPAPQEPAPQEPAPQEPTPLEPSDKGVPSESSSGAVETPYDCPPKNCYPKIDESSACDVATAKVTCSGVQVAQCGQWAIEGTVVGKWFFTSCGAGTECRIYDGIPVCDYKDKPCSY